MCFSTVARIALISGFLNWIFATFSFKFTQDFIGWSVSHICTPRVHRIVFMRSIFFEKHTLPNVFQILGGNFSGFWQIFPSTVLRTALVSRFFDRICAFFSDFTQSFIGWSVRTAPYASTRLLLWEASTLKKTLFNIVFHILGGKFSSLRQNFSSTVVKTAFFSRFST